MDDLLTLPTPAAAPTTRVLCVDDSGDILWMLRSLLDAEPRMECAGCLESADDLLAEARRLTAAPAAAALVVLLDATMPGKSALEAVREMAAELPGVRAIVFSGHDDPAFVDAALAAGAWGCISKHDEPGAILGQVREVAGRAVPGARWPRRG